MTDPARDAIVLDAATTRRWAETGTTIWSSIYNGGTLVALLCSTASTLVLAVNPETFIGIKTHALIAGVSAIAALAIGVPKYLNAENKWRANRQSRSEARILQRFLANPEFPTQKARDWLSRIERDHEHGIMGKSERARSER